ncbi:phage tail protein [Pseudomonas psychrophila]|uniref:phage major tail tube protein n=1 Tax=Pseudomonas psychrophila TaxID=122355 RepID=UPI00062A513E|nr:phage major tail tube protein [Pseudomonas psychrophila]KOX66784.1 phage tail protein [Pseudomonas psychrophila]
MIPQTLFNTNMFIAGQSLQGDVPSLSLPKVTVKTEEYRGGGMDAPVAMDMGLEKLESSFSTNGIRREVLKYFGAFDQTGFDASFRGAFKGQKGAVTAVVATLRGGLREVDPGEWSAGSKAEFKYAVDVTYYKLEIDGRVMFEIDPINCVRVIDGVDQLADVRNALGL